MSLALISLSSKAGEGFGENMDGSNNKESGRILAAVDGSPSSRSAAYAAAQMASLLHWSMHALYVVDLTEALEPYNPINRDLSELGDERPEGEKRLTLLEEQGLLVLEEVRTMCEKYTVSVTTEMMAGDIPSIILDAAGQYDILALGRRGNHHNGEMNHLGSNFRHIMHHCKTSVLVGASHDDRRNFRNLLLAYNGSDLSRCALGWTERLQSLFKEKIVISVGNEHLGQVWLKERESEITGSALVHPDFVTEIGEAPPSISRLVLARKTDLLVMGGHHHSHLLEWAAHSTLNGVLREVDVPILAAK